MTDQLAAPIPLTAGRHIGPLLRQLRQDAGLTLRQLSTRTHLSISGISKREQAHAGYVDIFVEHTRALGYGVALIPERHPGARETGTGWPA